MVSFIFFLLAAIANSVMDTSNHHFATSIFIKFNNRKFWDGSISWRNKYVDGMPSHGRIKWFNGLINKPLFFTDAWHLFKSLMIVFIVLSVVTYETNYHDWLMFILYGIFWNLTFNLFYNKILIK